MVGERMGGFFSGVCTSIIHGCKLAESLSFFFRPLSCLLDSSSLVRVEQESIPRDNSFSTVMSLLKEKSSHPLEFLITVTDSTPSAIATISQNPSSPMLRSRRTPLCFNCVPFSRRIAAIVRCLALVYGLSLRCIALCPAGVTAFPAFVAGVVFGVGGGQCERALFPPHTRCCLSETTPHKLACLALARLFCSWSSGKA